MLPTILVVEDNPITRKVVKTALATEGYEVIEAESGESALRELSRKPAQLVLQDLALGDMDGFELIRRLRDAAASPIPILAFSGFTNEKRVLDAGFDELLVKPIEPTQLVATVRKHLRHQQGGANEADCPAAAPRDRCWRAITAMLMRLNELAGGTVPLQKLIAEVLASLLDAAGFSVGIGFLQEPDGKETLCAHVGFPSQAVEDILRHCQRDRELPDSRSLVVRAESLDVCLSDTVQSVFNRAGAAALLTVPLTVRNRLVGRLLLGSANAGVSADWIQLAAMVSGPIAQSVMLASTVDRLATSEHKFRGIAESTGDGIVVTNSSGSITYLNEAAEALLQCSREVPVDRKIELLLPFLTSGARQGRIVRDGTEIPIEASVRSFEDPPGQVNRVYVLRDLTERLQLEEFAHIANYDPLTGVFNRRRFEEEINSRLAESRRHGTTGGLLLIDLDWFKSINDSFGHPAGDAVLKAVAEILRRNSRDFDAVARLGGDEFAVLLNHVSTLGAKALATRILSCLSNLAVPYEQHLIAVNASIGLSLFPADGKTVLELYAAADAALYQSKRLGRNRLSTCEGDESIPCTAEPGGEKPS